MAATRMSDIALPAFGFLGFFAGLLFVAQFTRWGVLVHVTCSMHGGDFLGAPRRRLIWATPFVALLHPVPWLMFAAAVLGYRTLAANTASGWSWFFGGLSLAILFLLFTT